MNISDDFNNYSIKMTPVNYEPVKWDNILRFIVFSPTILISFIGNAMVAVTKIRKKSGANSDVMLLVLSNFDIIKAVTFCLEYLTPKIRGYWILGVWACKVFPKILFAMFSVTASFTVLLTYDRYLIILHPFHGGVSRLKFRIASVVILAVHVLVFCTSKVFPFEMDGFGSKARCHNTAVADRKDGLFNMEIALALLYVLTSSILMSYVLRKATYQLLGRKELQIEKRGMRFRQNQTAVFVMRSVYVAYITSFVPWMCLYVTNALDPQKLLAFEESPWSIPLYFGIAGSFCNAPLTYVIFSKEFRHELIHICFGKAPQSPSPRGGRSRTMSSK